MRFIPGGLLVALGIVLAASTADAHARLVRSSPGADSVVSNSPSEIRLNFNEPIVAKLSTIALATRAGSKVALGPAAADPGDETELVAPLKDSLPAGVYQVHWHVVSADMHKVEGDFAFEVRP